MSDDHTRKVSPLKARAARQTGCPHRQHSSDSNPSPKFRDAALLASKFFAELADVFDGKQGKFSHSDAPTLPAKPARQFWSWLRILCFVN